MNPNEIITVEYSTVQHCYHVTTLPDMLQNNHIAVSRGINNGYLLIGLFWIPDPTVILPPYMPAFQVQYAEGLCGKYVSRGFHA